MPQYQRQNGQEMKIKQELTFSLNESKIKFQNDRLKHLTRE